MAIVAHGLKEICQASRCNGVIFNNVIESVPCMLIEVTASYRSGMRSRFHRGRAIGMWNHGFPPPNADIVRCTNRPQCAVIRNLVLRSISSGCF